MPIIKIKKRETPYVIMDQTSLNDDRLSWKAKGLLAYLLSKPPDWQVWVKDLIHRSPDGEHAVRTGLQELRDHRYVIYERERLPDGTFGPATYRVFETPQPEKPNVDNPNQGKPNQDNQGHTSIDPSSIDVSSKDTTLSATPTVSKHRSETEIQKDRDHMVAMGLMKPGECLIVSTDSPAPEATEEPKHHPIKTLLSTCEGLWGYPVPHGGKEAAAAKKLFKNYTEYDILTCLSYVMTDPFYRDKHVSLQIVVERIGPWIKLDRPTRVVKRDNGNGRNAQPGGDRAGGARQAEAEPPNIYAQRILENQARAAAEFRREECMPQVRGGGIPHTRAEIDAALSGLPSSSR